MGMPFSRLSVHWLMGRRVRLQEDLGSLPEGTEGVVNGYMPYRAGYMVEVQWIGVRRGDPFGFELFTADEYSKYLYEC